MIKPTVSRMWMEILKWFNAAMESLVPLAQPFVYIYIYIYCMYIYIYIIYPSTLYTRWMVMFHVKKINILTAGVCSTNSSILQAQHVGNDLSIFWPKTYCLFIFGIHYPKNQGMWQCNFLRPQHVFFCRDNWALNWERVMILRRDYIKQFPKQRWLMDDWWTCPSMSSHPFKGRRKKTALAPSVRYIAAEWPGEVSRER